MEVEIIFDKKKLLVSKTDTDGNILFANDNFCEVSGYSVEELMARPHNIIRHHDMPKWAFEDLWLTIKLGKTWLGFVKNKSKHGGYYWVFARVYGVTNRNGEKEYISVRESITEEEKIKYTKFYKKNYIVKPK